MKTSLLLLALMCLPAATAADRVGIGAAVSVGDAGASTAATANGIGIGATITIGDAGAATAASAPARRQTSGIPRRSGARAGSPCTESGPPRAAMLRSEAGRSA